MSDCSTQALKPKARPEVCPNCERSMTEHACEYEPSLIHLHCSHCGCSITRELKKPKDMDILNCPNVSKKTGFEREYLSQYHCESCKTDLGYRVLEQRYQQLEQVARSMWLDMNNYLDAIYERAEVDCDMPHSDACFIGDVNHYKKQLEALGVLND